MGGGEPGAGPNTRKDSSMTLLIRVEKGGRGTSLFYKYAERYALSEKVTYEETSGYRWSNGLHWGGVASASFPSS